MERLSQEYSSPGLAGFLSTPLLASYKKLEGPLSLVLQTMSTRQKQYSVEWSLRGNFSRQGYMTIASTSQDALNAHSGGMLRDIVLLHTTPVDTVEDSMIQGNVKIQGLHSALTVKATLTKPGKLEIVEYTNT